MQTEIALSSTESEYTGLLYALREAIPMIEPLKYMKRNGFKVESENPKAHCSVFEDNTGALEISRTHKYRPRTKHLNIFLHHFRDYVTQGEITIHHIDTTEQPVNFLIIAVNEKTLKRHRKTVMGW